MNYCFVSKEAAFNRGCNQYSPNLGLSTEENDKKLLLTNKQQSSEATDNTSASDSECQVLGEQIILQHSLSSQMSHTSSTSTTASRQSLSESNESQKLGIVNSSIENYVGDTKNLNSSQQVNIKLFHTMLRNLYYTSHT